MDRSLAAEHGSEFRGRKARDSLSLRLQGTELFASIHCSVRRFNQGADRTALQTRAGLLKACHEPAGSTGEAQQLHQAARQCGLDPVFEIRLCPRHRIAESAGEQSPSAGGLYQVPLGTDPYTSAGELFLKVRDYQSFRADDESYKSVTRSALARNHAAPVWLPAIPHASSPGQGCIASLNPQPSLPHSFRFQVALTRRRTPVLR